MIIGIIGNLSTGKTLTAVFLSRLFKKPIITNIKLNFKHEYMPFSAFVDWYQGVLAMPEEKRSNELKNRFKDKLWIADEMHNLINARDYNNKKFNLNVTQFFTMLGKLNTDVLYTAQLFESQIDLRVREMTNIVMRPAKYDPFGTKIIYEDRIVNAPRYIHVEIVYNDSSITDTGSFSFDPSDFYQNYDTHQIVITDRKS